MLVQTIWSFGAFAADVAEPTADMNLLTHDYLSFKSA
jgi:hypothetical protein